MFSDALKSPSVKGLFDPPEGVKTHRSRNAAPEEEGFAQIKGEGGGVGDKGISLSCPGNNW